MWIKREIEKTFQDLVASKRVVLVAGSRQVGKTSLLRQMYPDADYLSLDLPRNAQMLEEDGYQFLQKLNNDIILDEIQYAPSFFRLLKAYVDEHPRKKQKVLLTGSQKFELMKNVSESLAGRIVYLKLPTLSFHELRQKSKLDVSSYILSGGFPELHALGTPPPRFFPDYISTYLERDVRQIALIKDLRDFDRLLRLLASRVGQLLSYNGFATDLGVHPNTVKSWFSILEASDVISVLEPFYENVGKRLIKTPKYYFRDTGLLCALLSLKSIEQLSSSPLYGFIFENAVVAEFLKRQDARGERDQLLFFRDAYGLEVDLMVPNGPQWDLYEIKKNDSTKSRLQLVRVQDVLGKKVSSANCVTLEPTDTRLQGVRFKSFAEIFA